MGYSYDRTAAEDDTKAAISWLAPKRKSLIKKALKAMGAELDRVMKEAREKFPDMNESEVTAEVRKRETGIREGLQG